MSLKKVETVKTDKGFKFADIIIYAVIAVIIVVTFLVLFFTQNTDELSGISISVNDGEVFRYNFTENEYTIEDEERVGEITSDGAIIFVTIICDNGYNIVEIDVKNLTVSVYDSDCRGKDCLYQQIKNNSGIIYCSPHRMRVIPYNYEGDDGKIKA